MEIFQTRDATLAMAGSSFKLGHQPWEELVVSANIAPQRIYTNRSHSNNSAYKKMSIVTSHAVTHEPNPASAIGEVSGAFLLGLAQSFQNLTILPQGGMNLGLGEVDPAQWYPHSLLIDTLHGIENSLPSAAILFRAGMNFLRIWYASGPGKSMIYSGLDWLHANDESGGYNSVVRGGTKNEIGWCILQSIDKEAGIAVYENVMPLSPDFVRGVFYGGCILFDDMEYVQVDTSTERYAPNPSFNRVIVTVHFRLKSKTGCLSLDDRINKLEFGSTLALTPAEIESLIWRYKGLQYNNALNERYYNDINSVLSRAISESQRVTTELQNSQLLLQTAQMGAGLGHYVTDPNTGTWTNDATFNSIFGIDSKFERNFANWQRIMHPEDSQRVMDRFQEAIANHETSTSAEYRIIRPCDGKTVWIAAWGKDIFDSHGNAVRQVGLVQDITERKLVMEKLQEKNIEIERYTHMVSHDLKSPLVTIKTFMGYLQQDMAKGDLVRVEKDIDFVTKAADKMGQLLDELLEMSRIGRVVFMLLHATFHEVVKEAIHINAGAIAQRGVTVKIEGEDVKLFGDRARLVQVWQNLIDNAVKFMGDQPKPHILIGVQRYGSQLVFYVSDNGIGVEHLYHDKIFGMFEKLDAAMPGSGIGLALVKRIVQLHHGEIHIESRGTGQGSSFRFTLPDALKSNRP